MDQSELKMKGPCERPLSWTPCPSQVSEESRRGEFKCKFFVLYESSDGGEAHVFGVKFIGLYGTVGLLRFETFLFEEKAVCGVTFGQQWMEWFPS